jgi:hypothetical protein
MKAEGTRLPHRTWVSPPVRPFTSKCTIAIITLCRQNILPLLASPDTARDIEQLTQFAHVDTAKDNEHKCMCLLANNEPEWTNFLCGEPNAGRAENGKPAKQAVSALAA